MVFEVDNTTEQLIRELQDGIEGTIEGLRTGQREITDLITEVKKMQQGFARSGQIEGLNDLLENISEDVRKKATAEQLQNTAGQIENLTKNIWKSQTETTELLTGIQNTQTETSGLLTGIRDTQSEMGNLLAVVSNTQGSTWEVVKDVQATQKLMVQMVAEAIDTVLQERLRPLYELETKMDELSGQLLQRKEQLLQTAQNAVETVQRNQNFLKAIIAYLSLPGYKRFFKGMEVPYDAPNE